jgi:DNA-binding XRE family transcriptional regulator
MTEEPELTEGPLNLGGRIIRSPLGKLRADAGFSNCNKAAKALGVSHTYLAMIERGRCSCSESLAMRMAELYVVELNDIYYAINTGRLNLLKKLQESIEAP